MSLVGKPVIEDSQFRQGPSFEMGGFTKNIVLFTAGCLRV